jgi:hypothetical protein
MTVAAPPAAHRRRVLDALGVTPYVLRGRSGERATAQETHGSPVAATATASCVTVIPESTTDRQRRLLASAMQALGSDFARAACIVASDGGLREPPPDAAVYVAFGQAAREALQGHQPQGEVLVLDAPDALLQPKGKRQLWQVLRAWRRRSRTAQEA